MSERVRRFLLERPRVASLATIDPDGSPRQAVAWFRLEDDDTLVLNSRTPRRWPSNLHRDGRLALSVIDSTDGYRWVGLTGWVVEIVEDQEIAQADIAEMALRYDGEEKAKASIAMFRGQRRLTFRVRITGAHDHLGD